MYSRERGSILVLTVITVAVLMIVGVSFLSLASAEYLANTANAHRVQAFYEAEAGLAFGKQHVKTNIADYDFDGEGPYPIVVPQKIEIDTPLVALEKVSADKWELVSTSTVRRATQTVRVSVKPPTSISMGGPILIGDTVVHSPSPTTAFVPLNTYEGEKHWAEFTYKEDCPNNNTYYITQAGFGGNVNIRTSFSKSGYIDIFIQEFYFQSATGAFVIDGPGKVRFFIMNSFGMQDQDNNDFNTESKKEDLLIYPWYNSTFMTDKSNPGEKDKNAWTSNKANFPWGKAVVNAVFSGDSIEKILNQTQGIDFPVWGGN